MIQRYKSLSKKTCFKHVLFQAWHDRWRKCRETEEKCWRSRYNHIVSLFTTLVFFTFTNLQLQDCEYQGAIIYFFFHFFSTLLKCSVTSTSFNILHWLGCDVDLCSISNYKNRKTKQKIYSYIIIHNTVKTPQHNLGRSHIFSQYMIFFETTDLLFLCLI